MVMEVGIAVEWRGRGRWKEGRERKKQRERINGFEMTIMLAPMKVPMEKKDFKTLRPE